MSLLKGRSWHEAHCRAGELKGSGLSAIYGIGWLIYLLISMIARHLGNHPWQALFPPVPQSPEWTGWSHHNPCCWFWFEQGGGGGGMSVQCQPAHSAAHREALAQHRSLMGPTQFWLWGSMDRQGNTCVQAEAQNFLCSSGGSWWAHWGPGLEPLDT